MKKKKYLPLYKKWMKQGRIPHKSKYGCDGGLCSIFGNDKKFQLLHPTMDELEYRRIWGYWGLDENYGDLHINSFAPLRQTIVLLMAAMNNEL